MTALQDSKFVNNRRRCIGIAEFEVKNALAFIFCASANRYAARVALAFGFAAIEIAVFATIIVFSLFFVISVLILLSFCCYNQSNLLIPNETEVFLFPCHQLFLPSTFRTRDQVEKYRRESNRNRGAKLERCKVLKNM